MKLPLIAVIAIALGLCAGPLAAPAAQAAPPQGEVISVLGLSHAHGNDLVVHIIAVVPPGRGASDVAAEVLAEHGARPFKSADYKLSGLKWDQFFDGNNTNNQVVQSYNPANQPPVARRRP